MIIENYAPGIRALIEQIQERRKNQDPAIMESLNTLLKIGQREKDNALIGYAYLYMADSYYDNAYDYDDFMHYLTEGLKYQMLSGENELIARSYNLINIDAYYHGSHDMSLEALLTAKSYCDRLPSTFFHSVLLHNIGGAYNRIGDYDEAIHYRLASVEAMKEHPEDSQFYRNTVMGLDSVGIYYVCRDRIPEAEEIAERIDAIEATPGIPTGIFTESITLIFRALISYIHGDRKRYLHLEKQLLETLCDDAVLIDCVDDLLMFMRFLLRRNARDELEHLLPLLNAFLERDENAVTTKLLLLDFIAEYCDKADDREGRERAVALYCRYGAQQNKDRIHSCNFTLEMSRTMARQRAEQIRLLEDDIRRRHVAQTDALTDLPNTVYFMDRIEEALDSAIFRHANLGVSVMTIPLELSVDPSRLQEAVATLSALSTSGVCVTKGEANRLLVLYEDMPNSDILQHAADVTQILMPFVQDKTPVQQTGLFSRLFKEPQATGIPHGICTGVPSPETGGWEYLSVASEAMEASADNHFEITHFTL